MSSGSAMSTVMLLIVELMLPAATASAQQPSDPAAWGDDHVGQPFPLYMTGDECLFCHREIGTSWASNRHQLTIRYPEPNDPALKALRDADADVADDVQLLLGARRITRFLRRSDAYGKLELHGTVFRPAVEGDAASGLISVSHDDHWHATTFANRCAGCHATAVDTSTRAFSAFSLDCFTCHGDVQTDHTEQRSSALLAIDNRSPRQVISICGQCHLRGGSSASSGLPYPNTFVPGDNLFRDVQVDLSAAAVADRPGIDQHIFRNAREVVVLGNRSLDCLSCHDIHPNSSDKHKELEDSAICSSCHVAGTENSQVQDAIRLERRRGGHSRICDY